MKSYRLFTINFVLPLGSEMEDKMENVINGPIVTTKPPDNPYKFGIGDRCLAFITILMGYLFWEWGIIHSYYGSMGKTLFFVALAGISIAYFSVNKIKQSKTSFGFLGILMLSASQFVLFDSTPVQSYTLIFTALLYVLWIMLTTRTSINKKLNGFLSIDVINQCVMIPLCNFFGIFKAILNKENGKRSTVGMVVGVVVSIPLLTFVVYLLSRSDVNFQNFIDNCVDKLINRNFIGYLFHFALGIPVACFLFGSLYGNTRKRSSGHLNYESVNKTFVKYHGLNRPAVYAPLTVLNLIYAVFFIVLGSYLFSAFSGDLPATYTYAEYARKGFFELCGIAGINLILIAFAYTCVKRNAREYPRSLKILTGAISIFTVLFVVTAMSKMLLYIESYGLTRLRVYTLWFMVVIMFVFLLIIIWHIKSVNVGKPIIIGIATLILLLSFANTDGLIAKKNIEDYQNKKTIELDTYMLGKLSNGAAPYINELANTTGDVELKEELLLIINTKKAAWNEKSFIDYNLQSSKIDKL